MAEHKSKNTLGRSVPVKIVTDVEDDRTSEDESPRPVCTYQVSKKFEKNNYLKNKNLFGLKK